MAKKKKSQVDRLEEIADRVRSLIQPCDSRQGWAEQRALGLQMQLKTIYANGGARRGPKRADQNALDFWLHWLLQDFDTDVPTDLSQISTEDAKRFSADITLLRKTQRDLLDEAPNAAMRERIANIKGYGELAAHNMAEVLAAHARAAISKNPKHDPKKNPYHGVTISAPTHRKLTDPKRSPNSPAYKAAAVAFAPIGIEAEILRTVLGAMNIPNGKIQKALAVLDFPTLRS